MKAIFAGSFDPLTFGHIDIIKRALALFPQLIVAIGINDNKDTLFSMEERVEQISENLYDVEVIPFSGLLVDLAKEHNAKYLIRGLRDSSDFDYEIRMANVNVKLSNDIETIFFLSNDFYISSTIVKQIGSMGGDLSKFVPENIAKKIYNKYKEIEK